ncbi:MAG TPA: aspartyl/asparaginyl beta-hydroxylase domain-containing protein [Polyangiales bacterium]
MQLEQTAVWKATRSTGLAWGRKLLNGLAQEMARHSTLGDKPIFATEDLPWVSHMERHWRAVRRELDEVLIDRDHIPYFDEISPDQKHLTQPRRWRSFFFYGYGYRSDENCARCPQTARLLERIPGMKTAFFSILAPRTHILAHRGPYKGVLRYHLGLKVPEPELCRLRVDRELVRWHEGESLLFDDTYEHEAWNDSNFERVVLFVDVLRPLPVLLALGNEALVRAVGLSPLVQGGVRNFRRLSQHNETRAVCASRAVAHLETQAGRG